MRDRRFASLIGAGRKWLMDDFGLDPEPDADAAAPQWPDAEAESETWKADNPEPSIARLGDVFRP